MRLLLLSLALLLASRPAVAQVAADLAPSLSDGLQQPVGSFSVTDGPNAAVLNPAGLVFQEGLALRYLHQEGVRGGDFDAPNGDGLYVGSRILGALGWGFAVEWLRNWPGAGDVRRTTWALALGGDAFSLGAGVHLFSSDLADLDDAVTVDVGAVSRPNRWLSLGFAVRDVDASRVAGMQLPRRWVGSVGLRPLGDWLTLAVDGMVLGNEAPAAERGFDAMRLGYTARAGVVPGVALLGGLAHRVDGEGPVAFQAGLGLDLARLGAEVVPLLQSGGGDPGLLVGAELRARPMRGIDLDRRARVAVVDLERELQQPGGLQLFPGRPRDVMIDTVAGLQRLAADDRIDALVVHIRGLPGVGQGEAWELRQALLDFRATGKPVVAMLAGGDDTEYYVATAADRVFASPEGAFFVNGFATRVNYFADTLGLVGVGVDVARVGAWKNAPDQLTRNDASPEQAEVVDSILDDLFGRYASEVAEARRLEPARFRAALDTGIQSSQLARELGLVDEVIYPDQLGERLGSILDEPVVLTERRLRPEPWTSWGAPPVIAVIPIEGTIVGGRGGGDFGLVETTGAETVVEALGRAAADPAVRAIVLRIDSGGGDAAGSQRIWRAVEQVRQRKPVIATMGDAAASGGYYAAASAHRIFAAPGTLTGSIGIFWLKPSFEGLLDRLRVGSFRSTRGELADLLSFQREWSEAEQAAMQRYVDAAYREFVEAVARGRSLSFEEVDQVARGRVWTGAQARERGLVDDLGGLPAALRHARELGGIGADTPVDYRVYRPARALLAVSATGLSLELPRLQLPAPLEAALRDGIPAPLLLPNESGLWAVAPFQLVLR